jgi:hypothetical protein
MEDIGIDDYFRAPLPAPYEGISTVSSSIHGAFESGLGELVGGRFSH